MDLANADAMTPYSVDAMAFALTSVSLGAPGYASVCCHEVMTHSSNVDSEYWKSFDFHAIEHCLQIKIGTIQKNKYLNGMWNMFIGMCVCRPICFSFYSNFFWVHYILCCVVLVGILSFILCCSLLYTIKHPIITKYAHSTLKDVIIPSLKFNTYY